MVARSPQSDTPQPAENVASGDTLHNPWLRRADQLALAAIAAAALAAMIVYYLVRGGHRDVLIEIDQTEPLEARFVVDLNTSGWPELTTLPGIGEVTARRIVEWREQNGQFQTPDDLQKVHGIGPKTVERLRPYLEDEG